MARSIRECTLAQNGAAKMWHLLHGGSKGYINSLGALTGGQALQQAKAGIEAIYLSGWQVAAMPTASSMYPDQSLYPANSVPSVDRINNHLPPCIRSSGRQAEPNDPRFIDYFPPIGRVDGSCFGGVLNAFELMKSMTPSWCSGRTLRSITAW